METKPKANSPPLPAERPLEDRRRGRAGGAELSRWYLLMTFWLDADDDVTVLVTHSSAPPLLSLPCR